MNKITQLLLAGAVVFALCDVGLAQETPSAAARRELRRREMRSPTRSLAQESLPPPLPGSPDAGVGAGVLEALPRPRDTPRSLFGPEQPPSAGGIQIDGPYFVPDPLLDSRVLSVPGLVCRGGGSDRQAAPQSPIGWQHAAGQVRACLRE